MNEPNQNICFCLYCDWEGDYEETYEVEGQVICPKCHKPSVLLDAYACQMCDYICEEWNRDENGSCPACSGAMVSKNS
jgi:ssDNA-binding Zn-finger/Zn-ribbon topoisomerase 1